MSNLIEVSRDIRKTWKIYIRESRRKMPSLCYYIYDKWSKSIETEALIILIFSTAFLGVGGIIQLI